MKIARLLGATAVATVLAAPAMAQVVINQTSTFTPGLNFSGTSPALDLDSNNFAIQNVPGTSVSVIMNQQAANELNVVAAVNQGQVVPLQVANNSNFTVAQGAGAFTVNYPGDLNNPAGLYSITGDVDMNSINVISAGSTSAAVANALAAGRQTASNVANNAMISTFGASTGLISQQAGNLAIVSSNTMSAMVNNGNAVVGLPGVAGPTVTSSQQATASVNTASVYVGDSTNGPTPGVLTLTAKQQVLGPLNISATNDAVANSIASGSTVLDPVVQNLDQSSRIDVQTIGFSTAANGTAQVNLTSDQITNGVGNTFEIGNTAVGYTGRTTAPGYSFFTNNPGNGIAEVKAVNQTTTFVQNAVAGGAGVSVNLAGTNASSGFQQTADGTTTVITTPAGAGVIDSTTAPLDDFLTGGNVLPGIVNGMGARTYEGTANIAGGSQTFQNQQNYIGAGGTLSGKAVQTYSNVESALGNVALAEARVGASSISGIAQTNNQTYNTLAGGALNGDFTQNANNMQALTGNAQVAVGSTTASVTGADQKSQFGINSFSGGTLNGGNVSQNGDNIGIANVNILAAGGVSVPTSVSNATISGNQLALSSVNTGSLGAALGGTVTQTAGRVDITNVNSMNANTGLNASISGSQTSGSAINVIK